MKRMLAFLLSLVMILAATACSSHTSDTNNEEESTQSDIGQESGAGFTAIVCEDSAGAPFSQLVWSGFERIQEEFGTEIKFVEALEAAAYEQQLRAIAEQGANPVYCMFDAVSQIATDISAEYPDTFFCLIDSNLETDAPNVCRIGADSYDPSFIGGVLAAMRTSTGKVAWIGCYDSDVVNRYRDGFMGGVAYANEKFGLNVTVEVSHIGDAVDTVKGSEAAKIMIDRGADIVAQAANQAGIGVIRACEEANIPCIGCDSWQGDVSDVVFWTAIVGTDQAVYFTYEEFQSGNLDAGRHIYGITNGTAIYDDRDYEKLNDEEKAVVDEIIAGVKDGSLDIYSYNPNA